MIKAILLGTVAFIVLGVLLIVSLVVIATPMPSLNKKERKAEWDKLVAKQEKKNNRWYRQPITKIGE